MRYFIITIGVFLLLISCQDKSIRGRAVELGSSSVGSGIAEMIALDKEILEVYRNDSTLLSVYNDNTFRLVTLKRIEIEGNLNYERGLGEDIDATVYVLDFDKLGSEQYYARYTKNDSILVPLNQMREQTNKPELVKVKRK